MIKSKDRIVQLTTKGSKKITRDKNDLTLIPWPLLGASLSTNSQIQIGRQWFYIINISVTNFDGDICIDQGITDGTIHFYVATL